MPSAWKDLWAVAWSAVPWATAPATAYGSWTLSIASWSPTATAQQPYDQINSNNQLDNGSNNQPNKGIERQQNFMVIVNGNGNAPPPFSSIASTINQTMERHGGATMVNCNGLTEEGIASAVLNYGNLILWLQVESASNLIVRRRIMICFPIHKGIHMNRKIDPTSTAGEFCHTQANTIAIRLKSTDEVGS
jgi:hypothetical protein